MKKKVGTALLLAAAICIGTVGGSVATAAAGDTLRGPFTGVNIKQTETTDNGNPFDNLVYTPTETDWTDFNCFALEINVRSGDYRAFSVYLYDGNEFNGRACLYGGASGGATEEQSVYLYSPDFGENEKVASLYESVSLREGDRGWLVFKKTSFVRTQSNGTMDDFDLAHLTSVQIYFNCSASGNNVGLNDDFGRMLLFKEAPDETFSNGVEVISEANIRESAATGFKQHRVSTSGNFTTVSSVVKLETVEGPFVGANIRVKNKQETASFDNLTYKVDDEDKDWTDFDSIALEIEVRDGDLRAFSVYLTDGQGWDYRLHLWGGDNNEAPEEQSVYLYNENFEFPQKSNLFYEHVSLSKSVRGWLVFKNACFVDTSGASTSKSDFKFDQVESVQLYFNAGDNSAIGLDNAYGRVRLFKDAPNADFSNYTEIVSEADLAASAEAGYLDCKVSATGNYTEIASVVKSAKPAVPAPTYGDYTEFVDFSDMIGETDEAFAEYYQAWCHEATTTRLAVSRYSRGEGNDAIRYTVPASAGNTFVSLNIGKQSKYSNWSAWNTEEKTIAGTTVWVKNLSNFDVTFNFEVDANGGRYYIPANRRMMLCNTVTGAEIILRSSYGITIPAGFEGYVRVPRSAYAQADWSTQGPADFTPTNVTGIYITANVSVADSLDFAIDGIGVYYNDTEISTQWHKPANSFAANMGLN